MDVDNNQSEVKTDSEIQLVIFLLAKEQYGITITKVQEINRMVAITKLPHTPHFMEGIINLRGEIIPVIDLRKRFDLVVSDYTDESRVIIVQANDEKVGIIVDSVAEVVRISTKNIEPPPASFALEAKYLQGVGKINDNLICLLDIDKVMTSQEVAELKQFNA